MTLNEEIANVEADIVNQNGSGMTSLFGQQMDAFALKECLDSIIPAMAE